ncbi:MAG TPA: DUF3574 domain-containing protein, partial [Longimicrobium sp.]|nr:DUF3574 domain-containing protein [Longimicrobium sp.]
MMPFRRRAALVVFALVAGGCAPAVRAHPPVVPAGGEAVGEAWVSDRLYFGRGIPGGGTVSDTAWAAFLREAVTPRFPAGLTVLRGEGQWRDEAGVIIQEATFVLELLHPPGAEADAALDEIAAEYKRRFRQESVMRVRASADVRFHEEE